MVLTNCSDAAGVCKYEGLLYKSDGLQNSRSCKNIRTFSASFAMCGIFAVISKKEPCKNVRELAYEHSRRQRHRGPDYTGVVDWSQDAGVVMVHERLAILGVRDGNQPFVSSDGNLLLIANGELYNYVDVAKMISERRGETYKPRSDSDVIIALYEEFELDMLEHVSGMFAFVLYDRQRSRFVAARDPIGIIPMYQGSDSDGNLYFASEMKCLVGLCEDVEAFEPGVLLHGRPGGVQKKSFYSPAWFTEIPTQPFNKDHLRQSLEDAVRSHLQCDVPFGAMLSGGLDSSLIASIATRLMRQSDPSFRLKTFSVGLKDAPDLVYARKVAQFIGSEHEEVHFTVEEGIDCIRSIIYHTESYDVSVIRCSKSHSGWVNIVIVQYCTCRHTHVPSVPACEESWPQDGVLWRGS